MPRDLFKEAGITQAEIEQFKAKSSPRDLFAEAGITPEEIKQYKEQNSGIFNKILNSSPVKAFENAGYGMGQAVQELPVLAHNLVGRGVNALGGNVQPWKDPEITKDAPNPGSSSIASVLASMALPLGGVSKLKNAAKGSNALARALASLGDAGATGAGYGMLYGANNENKSLADSGKTGALIAALIHSGASGVDKAWQGASSLYRGKRAAADARKISDTVGDLPVPLGSVVDSPVLNAAHGLLRFIPGSGVKASRENLVAKTDKITSDMVKEAGEGTNKSLVNSDLQNILAGNYDKQLEKSNKLYGQLTKEMDDAGIGVNKEGEFTNTAKEILNNEDKMRGFTVGKSLLSSLKNAVNDKSDKYSHTDAHFQRSRILEKQREAQARGNNTEASIYGRLAKSLENDIHNAVESSNNKNLIKLRDEAQAHFKDNITPYRNFQLKDLILNRDSDGAPMPTSKTEKIVDALKKPENKRLVEHMTPEQKSVLHFGIFSKKAEETPDGIHLSLPSTVTEFKNLSQPQREMLFNDEQIENLNKMKDLNNITSEIRKRAKPPQTGFALKDDIDSAAKISAAITAAKSGIPGLSALAAVMAGGSTLRKTLEDPSFRKSFIENSTNRQPKKVPQTALMRAMAAYINSEKSN